MAPNTPILLIFRLLAGIFGSSPLANAGGAVADIWRPHERAVPSSIYSSGPWFGPSEQTSLYDLTALYILTSASLWTTGRSRFIRPCYHSAIPIYQTFIGILDDN
jgi:MFS family permease